MADQDKDQLTEEATPRKKEKTREKGEVARSRDVGAVAAIGGTLAALWACWSMISTAVVSSTVGLLSHMDDDGKMAYAGRTAFETLLVILGPMGLTVLTLGVFAEVAQVGWKPTLKPLVPDLNRLNPLSKLKNMLFSSSTAIELAKSMVKIMVIGTIGFKIIYSEIGDSGRYIGLSGGDLMKPLALLFVRLTVAIGAAVAIMAILDVLIERHRHGAKIKMSKQEVKDEYKQMEGDPAVRGMIRSKQRELMRRRMLEDLKSADVVVTNPTHYAVALRYKMGSDPAPIIVALGASDMAAKIRARARSFGIPITSNPPLARGLFAKGKLGAPIPTEFYKVVAALLAWVYRIGGRVA